MSRLRRSLSLKRTFPRGLHPWLSKAIAPRFKKRPSIGQPWATSHQSVSKQITASPNGIAFNRGALPTRLSEPTDNRQPTTDNRQPTTDNRQPPTANRQPTTDNRQPENRGV